MLLADDRDDLAQTESALLRARAEVARLAAEVRERKQRLAAVLPKQAGPLPIEAQAVFDPVWWEVLAFDPRIPKARAPGWAPRPGAEALMELARWGRPVAAEAESEVRR